MSRRGGENGKKKPVLFKALIAALIAVLAVVLILIVWKVKFSEPEYYKVEREDTGEEEKEEEEEETGVSHDSGSEDFVIFGVDTRSTNLESGTRSDSIMIVHVDHDGQTVKVASIYRDCMVHIEGYDYEKITHAHSYGGPDLALSTINENFDLDIEKYLTVNFISVGDLIDEIGGIEQDITEEELEYINSYIDEVNEVRGTDSAHINVSGTHTLDGTQAVAYSRIRYTSGGDYTRSERQRSVLFAVFEAAKEMEADDRVELAEEMIEEINTNYSTNDLTSMLYYLSQYEITEMTAYPQVFYSGTVDGAWVEVPVTLVDMNESLHEFLYGETDYTPSETVQSYSNTLQEKAGTANNDLRDEEDTEEGSEEVTGEGTETDTDTEDDAG